MEDVIGPHQTNLVSCRGNADIIGKIVDCPGVKEGLSYIEC